MNEASINLLVAVVGAIIGILGYIRVTKNDVKDDTEESTSISVELKAQLNYISKGVDDIRLDIKAQANKIEDMGERLTRVEESTKSAHHRLNDIEEKIR